MHQNGVSCWNASHACTFSHHHAYPSPAYQNWFHVAQCLWLHVSNHSVQVCLSPQLHCSEDKQSTTVFTVCKLLEEVNLFWGVRRHFAGKEQMGNWKSHQSYYCMISAKWLKYLLVTRIARESLARFLLFHAEGITVWLHKGKCGNCSNKFSF